MLFYLNLFFLLFKSFSSHSSLLNVESYFKSSPSFHKIWCCSTVHCIPPLNTKLKHDEHTLQSKHWLPAATDSKVTQKICTLGFTATQSDLITFREKKYGRYFLKYQKHLVLYTVKWVISYILVIRSLIRIVVLLMIGWVHLSISVIQYIDFLFNKDG